MDLSWSLELVCGSRSFLGRNRWIQSFKTWFISLDDRPCLLLSFACNGLDLISMVFSWCALVVYGKNFRQLCWSAFVFLNGRTCTILTIILELACEDPHELEHQVIYFFQTLTQTLNFALFFSFLNLVCVNLDSSCLVHYGLRSSIVT